MNTPENFSLGLKIEFIVLLLIILNKLLANKVSETTNKVVLILKILK